MVTIFGQRYNGYSLYSSFYFSATCAVFSISHYYFIIRKKNISAIFFLRSKGFCVYPERTVLLSQIFSLAALPQGNCRHCSGRKPPTATWLLSCVTRGDLAGQGDQRGKALCLLCTLPVSLRSVLAISLLSVSLVADKEFSRIMAPSARKKGTFPVGPWEKENSLLPVFCTRLPQSYLVWATSPQKALNPTLRDHLSGKICPTVMLSSLKKGLPRQKIENLQAQGQSRKQF